MPNCTCCNGTGNHGDQKGEEDHWVGRRGVSESGIEEPVFHWKCEPCLPGVGWVELWHLWVRLHLPQCSRLKCLQNAQKWWLWIKYNIYNSIELTKQFVLRKPFFMHLRPTFVFLWINWGNGVSAMGRICLVILNVFICLTIICAQICLQFSLQLRLWLFHGHSDLSERQCGGRSVSVCHDLQYQ